jgi:hypothetical protein
MKRISNWFQNNHLVLNWGKVGRGIAQTISRWLPTAAARYIDFPCQSSFHQILHHHNHPEQATIGQSVAAAPSGPSWTPPPTKRIIWETRLIKFTTPKVPEYTLSVTYCHV